LNPFRVLVLSRFHLPRVTPAVINIESFQDSENSYKKLSIPPVVFTLIGFGGGIGYAVFEHNFVGAVFVVA
jgi:hypothetical protein